MSIQPELHDEKYASAVQHVAYEIGHRAVSRVEDEHATEITLACLEWLYAQQAIDVGPYTEMLIRVRAEMEPSEYDRHREYILEQAQANIAAEEENFLVYNQQEQFDGRSEEEILQSVLEWMHSKRIYTSSVSAVETLSGS